MSIFTRKPLSTLLAEASDSGEHTLKKTLGTWGLISLGIGAIIGAGLFSITGMAAADYAGPSIVISFIIAALGCALAGLCYAEFASMIPVAGSAYTYSYATMGEFVAWIIGWDLVLEYAVGAATVASSWSGYLDKFLQSVGINFPPELLMTPFDSMTLANGDVVTGLINLPAVFIVTIMSLVLIRGTQESSFVNAIIVVMKVVIVLIFIVVGFQYIRPENHVPFIPENTGKFGEFGFSGIIRAAAVVFFAYIGFDAVSTAAQETKNPKKSMPLGILGSLLICTVLYILFAFVMTGVANYEAYGADPTNKLAPVAIAISNMGDLGPDGVVHAAYPWLNTSIVVAILLGYASVILVLLLGQSRVFYSMSKDGLVPKIFSSIHPKFQTPHKSNLFFLLFVSIFAAFVPGRVVGEMTSIGTLFAFILVCAGVLVLRKSMPDAPRAFRVPLVPLIPILGILVCFFMMAFLPLDTWMRLILWMIVGLDVYLFYGLKNSHLTSHQPGIINNANKFVGISGLVLSIALIIVAVAHHQVSEVNPSTGQINDAGLYYFSMAFGIIHLLLYIFKTMKGYGTKTV
ncbi:amino acid permease [Moheibacter sediminis]|uniref:Amino acid/polyamine/organocation transporter, APC superfamily n=1 Tax=Moheibacter sediminis TaxID=1434700 RepID=A0A1W1ZBF9_9FLAO|nr:amino acid permease [Moheibacter sediminis]SMC45753.1 amino acid/polyamine/organocation transporter, APC superfamily [Moheibacter sediminis]